MKLQLALDILETAEAVHLAELTKDYIDIIEIGTPLIKHEGVEVIKTLRKRFPDKELLVDLKIMDAGEYESDFCFHAGANMVTVLGVADLQTIKGVVKSASSHKGKVVVDFINVQNKVYRAVEVINTHCDFIAIHTGIDQQHIKHP